MSNSNSWKINDGVYVDRKLPSLPTLQGIIAYLGPVKFAEEKDWVGVRLTGPSVGLGQPPAVYCSPLRPELLLEGL